MKKFLKYLGYSLGVVLITVAALLSYVKIALPDVGAAPDMKVDVSAAKLERGKYLANHVMLCMDCHSTRDWNQFSGPLVPGSEGKGGELFDQKLGCPGKYIAPNITPYNLQHWSDGELFRSITEGVTKDGRALFPIMPYHLFGQLDRNDIEAVIAYIRNLKPIESVQETSSSDFPMNFIINTMPEKATLSKMPPKSDTLNYGKYMITASGCMDCHTKQEQGKFVGQLYAGGFEIKLPDGSVVRSANLTPDKESGIGNWSKNYFIKRFKMYADSAYVNPVVKPGDFQTIMPWTMYAGMDTVDLAAIYKYLKHLDPVYHVVEKFTPVN